MFEFSTDYSVLFTSLFLIISIFISFLFYRKTSIFKWKKYLLITIKSIAFFLLLVLFIQPILLSALGISKSPLNIILADNSRSISINADKQVRDILKNIPYNSGSTKLFTFSNNIEILNSADSFLIGGAYTDLSGSLEQLKLNLSGNPVNSVTIISDGNFNSGGNPLYTAKTLNAPFIIAPAGDSIQRKDIIIYNAACNKTSFINTKLDVVAYIKSFDTDNTINITLEREGIPVTEKTLSLKKDENLYNSTFEITEGTPGKYKYRLKAENTEGEVTFKNNFYDFYIEFLDNKIKLLFISGGPSYDNAVISRIVNRLSNFEVINRVLKSASEFYEGSIDPKIYGDISAIMLLNFPSAKYSGNELENIYNNSLRFKIPVIFFAGRNSDYRKLELIQDIVPFTVSQLSTSESSVKLQPVTNPQATSEEITFNSGNTPELNRNIKGIIPKPGAVTLIMDKFSGEPVLLTRNNGSFSTTAFLAYGFWRWMLKGTDEKKVGEIIEKCIKISLNKNKNRNFIITPVKDFFDYTEDVITQAEVFDENNNPASNAVVNGIIKDKNGNKIKEMDFQLSKEKYFANFGKMQPGDYFIEGDAEINQSIFSKDNNRFTVDTLNTEYLQTASDFAALRELVNNTGGSFTTPENLNKTITETHNSSLDSDKSIFSRINLRENSLYLGLIILLFTIEWVVRKRNNIP